MKRIKKSAQVSTAYGQPLPSPLGFDYEFDELQKGDEIPADEQPDEDDIRAYVNTKRNSAARAKAQNEALEAANIKKPTLEDPDVRLKQMVKLLIANGVPQETAETQARTVLGM